MGKSFSLVALFPAFSRVAISQGWRMQLSHLCFCLMKGSVNSSMGSGLFGNQVKLCWAAVPQMDVKANSKLQSSHQGNAVGSGFLIFRQDGIDEIKPISTILSDFSQLVKMVTGP